MNILGPGRLPTGLLAAIAAMAIGGCDGSNSAPTATIDDELLSRISAAHRATPASARDPSRHVAYVDVAAARKQLDLPANAGFPGSGSRDLLWSMASRPLFLFAPMLWSDPNLGPLGDVLDSGRVDAVAGTSFALSGPLAFDVNPWDVAVLRTRQAFSAISASLREIAEYREASDGLLVRKPNRPLKRRGWDHPYGRGLLEAVADAGEGVVVLGGSERSARAALAGADSALATAAQAIVELPGVSRVVRAPGRGCLKFIGIGEDASPRDGEVVIDVEGPAEPSRLLTASMTYAGISTGAEVRFSKPKRSGDLLRVPFVSTDGRHVTRLPIEEVSKPFECS